MLDDTERTVLEQDDHDWPDKLPAHQWRAPRTAYTRVRPDLVVEVARSEGLPPGRRVVGWSLSRGCHAGPGGGRRPTGEFPTA